MNTTIEAQVVRRSSNTNSFGLREHIIVCRNGYAFKACRSAYVPDAEDYTAGSPLSIVLRDFDPKEHGIELAINTALHARGFELVQSTAKCPTEVLAEIFN